MTNRPDSEWLARNLARLLSSPEVGIPEDIFSARFYELFSQGAKGKVDGIAVDRAGLEEALLAMEKTWNDTASATAGVTVDPEEIVAELCWTPNGTGVGMDVSAAARTIEEGGSHRINFLQLDGMMHVE